MTVSAADLPRAFDTSTAHGDCAICAQSFNKGERAFYATVHRDGNGLPIWTPEAQVAPKDARTEVRPQGCTCRGRSAHGARCALYRECSCPMRSGRGRSRYQAHRRSCSNKIRFEDRFATLPGFFDHAVHCACASERGLEIPEAEKRTFGRRVAGIFTTGAALPPVPPAPAPAATPRVGTVETIRPVVAELEPGVTAALDESREAVEALRAAQEAGRARRARNADWMGVMARDFRDEREASIRARAEQAETNAAERQAREDAERTRVAAERSTEPSRFGALDLDDAPEGGESTYANVERFAALDLD